MFTTRRPSDRNSTSGRGICRPTSGDVGRTDGRVNIAKGFAYTLQGELLPTFLRIMRASPDRRLGHIHASRGICKLLKDEAYDWPCLADRAGAGPGGALPANHATVSSSIDRLFTPPAIFHNAPSAAR